MRAAAILRSYLALQTEEEHLGANLAAIMGCYGMRPADGFQYAREAQTSVGVRRAYQAAAEGHPFMLPWRAPA